MLVIQHYDFDGTTKNEMTPGRRQYLHAAEARTHSKVIVSSRSDEREEHYQISSQGDEQDSTRVHVQVAPMEGKRL